MSGWENDPIIVPAKTKPQGPSPRTIDRTAGRAERKGAPGSGGAFSRMVPRTNEQRGTDNFIDAAARSVQGMLERAPGRRDGAFIANYAGATGGFMPVEAPSDAADYDTGKLAAEAERVRRETYESVSAQDPFYGSDDPLGAGAATLLGQLAGSAIQPESWLSAGSRVATRVMASSAINALIDVAVQGGDTLTGTQDQYNVGQTVGAAAIGATFQGGAEVLAKVLTPRVPSVKPALPPYDSVKPVKAPSIKPVAISQPTLTTAPEPIVGPVGTLKYTPVAKAVVIDSTGTRTPVTKAIVDVGDLIASNDATTLAVNPAYNADLQPRDRQTKNMAMQIDEITNRFDPERLIDNGKEAQTGEPIVGSDGMVESGNGRVITLQRIYAEGGESAARYRQALIDAGYEIPEGVTNPVLVRVTDAARDVSERQRLTLDAQKGSSADLTIDQIATADSKLLTPEIFALHKGGDTTKAENAPFVRDAIKAITRGNVADYNTLINDKGLLTAAGQKRLDAAMAKAAYDNDAIVRDLFESTDEVLRGIGRALVNVAPDVTNLKADIAAGRVIASVDPTKGINDAVDVVKRFKSGSNRGTIQDFLNNTDAFAEPLSPDAQAFLGIFFRPTKTGALGRQRSEAEIARLMRDVIDVAGKKDAAPDMFGEVSNATATDLAATIGNRDAADVPNDLLAGPDGGSSAGLPEGSGTGNGTGIEPTSGPDRGEPSLLDEPPPQGITVTAQSGGAAATPANKLVAATISKAPANDFWGKLFADIGKYGRVEGLRWQASKLLHDFTTGLVDKANPVKQLELSMRRRQEQLSGRAVSVPVAQSPYARSRALRWNNGAAIDELTNGIRLPGNPDNEPVSLVDALMTAIGSRYDEETMREFGGYLKSRVMVQRWERREKGLASKDPDGLDKSRHLENIRIVESDPTKAGWVQAADMVNQVSQDLLLKKLLVGRITQEDYDNIVNSGMTFYVPSNRVRDPDGAALASGQLSVGPKGFKGSDLDTIDPILSLQRQIIELSAWQARNEAKLALFNFSKTLTDLEAKAARKEGAPPDPRGNAFITVIPAKSKPVNTSVEEVLTNAKTAAEKAGDEDLVLTINDFIDGLDEDVRVSIYRPAPVGNGKLLESVWIDGEIKWFQINDAETAVAFNELLSFSNNDVAKDVLVNLLSIPTKIAQAFITKSPDFLVANPIRDQPATAMTTNEGYIPFFHLALGMFDVITNSDVARRFAASGGISGDLGVADIQSITVKGEMKPMMTKGFWARYFGDDGAAGKIEATLNRLRNMTSLFEITETATRVSLFKLAYKNRIKEGFTPADATQEAVFVANDLFDYQNGGSRMISANKLVIFLNAQLQGLYKTYRVATADGALFNSFLDIVNPLDTGKRLTNAQEKRAVATARNFYIYSLGLTAVGLAQAALFSDDPEYQEIGRYTRDRNWVIRLPIAPNLDDLPPGISRDDLEITSGGSVWMKIPKPFELALTSNFAERSYESIVGKDPAAMKKFWSGAFDVISPINGFPDIPLVKVGAELALNKNFATGRPIVEMGDEGKSPQYQYNSYTSELAKGIGKTFGLSPAQVDHVINGFTTSMGGYVTASSNLTDPDRPEAGLVDWPFTKRFFTTYYRGAAAKTEFWEQLGPNAKSLMQASVDYNEIADNAGVAAAEENLKTRPMDEYLYTAAMRGINREAAEKRLHPMERARQASLELSQVLKELNGALPQDKTNPLPPMTAAQKRVVQIMVSQIQVAEMRNAMIVSDVSNYQGLSMMEVPGRYQELKLYAPGVYSELMQRYGKGTNQVYDYTITMDAWPTVRTRLVDKGTSANINDIAGRVKRRSEALYRQ